MNRICATTERSNRVKHVGAVVRLCGVLFVLSLLSISGQGYAAPIVRIAVAPFAGEEGAGTKDAPSVAMALAERLSQRGFERILAPGDFVAASVFEPRASEIRRWAYNSAVDTIVVGRVSRKNGTGKNGPRVVETVIRSGHSGAEISRHDVILESDRDLDRSIEKLATAIFIGLGHVARPADAGPPRTPVSPVFAKGSGDARPENDDSHSSGRILDGAPSESKFGGDSPIEIQSEEAEIINHNDGRKLIFQTNVRVRQDNVSLRSDRLEAWYRKGESQPHELIAEGHVRITQDNRLGKCDRAVYLREENRLTCSGHAELVQGCDIVRGDSIEFDFTGNRARVEGAASIVVHQKKKGPLECQQGGGPT